MSDEPAQLGDEDPEEAGGLFDEPGVGGDTPHVTRGGAAPTGDESTPSHPEPSVGRTQDKPGRGEP